MPISCRMRIQETAYDAKRVDQLLPHVVLDTRVIDDKIFQKSVGLQKSIPFFLVRALTNIVIKHFFWVLHANLWLRFYQFARLGIFHKSSIYLREDPKPYLMLVLELNRVDLVLFNQVFPCVVISSCFQNVHHI